MGNVFTIAKRELRGYFNSPLAYVFIIIFLIMSQSFAFLFGGFFERGEASLAGSFFTWHPWLFMVFAPAVGMRLWSEEQRQGTIELLLTMPIAPWQAIVGKFLAAAWILFLCLALTFPIVMTVGYLGKPDFGVIVAGYIASYFVALSFLAVTLAVSAFTRSQVVCFVVSVAICLFLILVGFPPVVDVFNYMGDAIKIPNFGEMVGAFGVLPHFEELSKGILVFRDLIFFISVIGFCLFVTSVIIRTKRA